MSNLDVIKDLYDKKLLKQLVVAGLFPAKTLARLEMYYHVNSQMAAGVLKTHAVNNTSEKFSVTPDAVYKALKSLSVPIEKPAK